MSFSKCFLERDFAFNFRIFDFDRIVDVLKDNIDSIGFHLSKSLFGGVNDNVFSLWSTGHDYVVYRKIIRNGIFGDVYTV